MSLVSLRVSLRGEFLSLFFFPSLSFSFHLVLWFFLCLSYAIYLLLVLAKNHVCSFMSLSFSLRFIACFFLCLSCIVYLLLISLLLSFFLSPTLLLPHSFSICVLSSVYLSSTRTVSALCFRSLLPRIRCLLTFADFTYLKDSSVKYLSKKASRFDVWRGNLAFQEKRRESHSSFLATERSNKFPDRIARM